MLDLVLKKLLTKYLGSMIGKRKSFLFLRVKKFLEAFLVQQYM